tara:strand:+ start:650 stop:877 length:228 start_codon:yes stop_codon:yes gene_type:complete
MHLTGLTGDAVHDATNVAELISQLILQRLLVGIRKQSGFIEWRDIIAYKLRVEEIIQEGRDLSIISMSSLIGVGD